MTPVSAPANLLAVPLCALVLVSNMTSLLLTGWFPAAAEIFNHAGWFLMECIRVTSQWFADWPGAYFYVSAPSVLGGGLYYFVLLAVLTGWLFKPKWRAWKFAALASVSLVWCWQSWHEWSATRLTILPLNGGHAIYCDAPGHKNDLLVDCGDETTAEFIVKPFLHARGVNRLNRLLLTHGDVRHIGGAELINREFSARQIVTSTVRFRSPDYRKIIEELQCAPERCWKVIPTDEVGSWKVLHPRPADNFPQADDNALVLLGTIHDTRILLLSDLGRPGQNALLERTPDLRADIVITGLPVEGEPLGDALLNAVQPRLVIVADSEFPATARASAKLRERLAQRHVPVVYTRDTGAVTLKLRKINWTATTMNEPLLAEGPSSMVLLLTK